ncbi:hypothetical protein PIB30_081647 [Stylosanthes scabra]|uniref:Uncharacterized protein n=1 Tax=Stylosanthes scabra TaxID=79078 RepID=A0ABU6WQ13_9FABA|nr:hypothetical protein [Stylosanthes scabra]
MWPRVPPLHVSPWECDKRFRTTYVVTTFRNNEFRGFYNREEAETWIASDQVVEEGTATGAGHGLQRM